VGCDGRIRKINKGLIKRCRDGGAFLCAMVFSGTVGVSLLAIAVFQSTLMATDTPPSSRLTPTGLAIGRRHSTDRRNRLKAIPAFFRNHLRISLPALNFPNFDAGAF
jgi:hypothetical protein